MGKVSRRALLRGLVVTGSAAAVMPANATAHVPVMQNVPGLVAWFNRMRGLLMFEADGTDQPRVFLEVRGAGKPEHSAAVDLRPMQRLALVFAPSEDVGPLSPWQRLHAILSESGEHLPLEARLISVTWTAPDRLAHILQVVSAHFGVSTADILSVSRAGQIVRARQTGIYLSHKLTMHSQGEIGRRFGDRDHTTVLHAIKKIQHEVDGEQSVRQQIEGLRQRVLDVAWTRAPGAHA